MAGRIREDDIAEVREKVRIDEVVGDYVTLRNAGGGSMKGLCPFHDEKSPIVQRQPERTFFHCFGCQEGGDVITFLMKIDGLSFTEAVERLADKVGVSCAARRATTATTAPRGRRGCAWSRPTGRPGVLRRAARRGRTPSPGGVFLSERGFDQAAAEMFGMGFAPRDGEALCSTCGVAASARTSRSAPGSSRSAARPTTGFRGRLLWPIRDPSGATIGFGARRIFDDDKIEAKYLNTPETTLYKKSQVLYGIDLARKDIGKSSQAVVVEGYTDVMACHLAGVTTAVASCGTAFGEDHTRVLRRFLHDHEEFRGEVIFTFDGDAAGQNAALKTFAGRPAVRLPDLRRGGARRPRPVRRYASATATPPCATSSRAASRSTASCSATSWASSTSTAPTGGSTRRARGRQARLEQPRPLKVEPPSPATSPA